MLRYCCFLSVVFIALAGEMVSAQDKPVVLKSGDAAPHFVGTTDEKKPWDSKKLAGKKIYVVYFYPADMTPGCTAQACAYRDALKDLKREDIEVLGVSGDSVENHQHFKREYDLNFTLLADPEGKIAQAFGVQTRDGGAIEKMIAGQPLTLERGVTASRWTFIIDPDWKIAHVDRRVNAARDGAKVLKIIEELAPASSEGLKDAHDASQPTVEQPLGNEPAN